MSGLEKILDDIRGQAESAAAQILSEAEESAKAIREEAKANADATCREILSQGEKGVALAKERALSSSQLMGKRQILGKKQEILRGVFEEALARAQQMPEREYFDVILKMACANAHKGESGTIAFGEKDLGRLPQDFAARLAASLPEGASLRVAEGAVPIEGGFMLSYGGIEENCSFSSILEAKKEELQDEICRILFPAAQE